LGNPNTIEDPLTYKLACEGISNLVEQYMQISHHDEWVRFFSSGLKFSDNTFSVTSGIIPRLFLDLWNILKVRYENNSEVGSSERFVTPYVKYHIGYFW